MAVACAAVTLKLDSIVLHGNSFSSTIPDEIGLFNGTIANFSKNSLLGPSPNSLFSATNSWYVGLGMNEITGTLPTKLGNLLTLKTVHLENTKLDGTLPSEIGQLKHLLDLNMANAGLLGTIPDELYSGAPKMKQFDIAGNSFSGTISSNI